MISDVLKSTTHHNMGSNYNLPVTLWSFNCHGFKTSSDFTKQILHSNNCDIMFISEHWLNPGDMSQIQSEMNKSGYWTSMKSSMDPEQLLLGRPHGGVGLFAKRIDGVTFKPIVVNSDRVCGMQLICQGKSLLTIIGVYLPYYNGEKEQIQLYSETLDILQSVIDTCESPIMLAGDMNATLPRNHRLSLRWYRQHPFNHNSMLLHDFLSENGFIVANYEYDQPVSYTYWNGNRRTYIDHVLISNYASGHVRSCQIMSDITDNNSDHHPLQTVIDINIPMADTSKSTMYKSAPKYPRINWSDQRVRSLYQKYVAELCPRSNVRDIDSGLDKSGAEDMVNVMCDDLVEIFHKATSMTADDHSSRYKGHHKKNNWWSWDCTITRDRQRFWFTMWKDCGRPREGYVYSSYKLAKKAYRDACRLSVNNNINITYRSLNSLYGRRNLRKFWNEVRTTKNITNNSHDDIPLQDIIDHYQAKFKAKYNNHNPVLTTSSQRVNNKYKDLVNTQMEFVISESRLIKCIDKLRLGCAHGLDGVLAEHVTYTSGSGITLKLCSLLTLCVRYGVVPRCFQEGLLIPILKKTNLDPSTPKNYRPITISSTLAKILEVYILEESGEHTFSDLQFGFIGGRGTDMAAALAHDVTHYSTKRGSAVYMCSLDAQGAFDELPHPILFNKCIDVVPDHCWRILVRWYSDLSVRIRWGNDLSELMPVTKGTHQGGLSSPFLFNVFYQDLVNKLSNTVGGININGHRYNVFCYADDILLASLTVTGLQTLINTANTYISSHGLCFNPAKTECITLGNTTLCPNPRWRINDTNLQNVDSVSYLGVMLSNSPSVHVNSRITACRRAFYALQGSGMCKKSHPDTTKYLWIAALRPVLLYGLNAVHVTKNDQNALDKTQTRLLKTALGVSKFCRNTPLLDALRIQSVGDMRDMNQLRLLRSSLKSDSRARTFYYYMMTCHMNGHLNGFNILVNRVKTICDTKIIDFMKYNLVDEYAKKM